jgi:hypothetical protein
MINAITTSNVDIGGMGALFPSRAEAASRDEARRIAVNCQAAGACARALISGPRLPARLLFICLATS